MLRVSRRVNVAIVVISAIGIAYICIGTLADAGSRSFGAGSIPIVYDLNLTALVLAVALPLGAVQSNGGNPEFTFALRNAPKKLAMSAQSLGLLLAGGVVGWVAFASAQEAVHAFVVAEERMGIASFPTWPAKAAVALGFIWLVVILLQQTVTLLRGQELSAFAEASDEFGEKEQ